MRKDLIGAKAYKIGYKAPECGDIYFNIKIVETFEEACEMLDKWESRGYQTTIRAYNGI